MTAQNTLNFKRMPGYSARGSYTGQNYPQSNCFPLVGSTTVAINVKNQSVFTISWAPILSLYIHIKKPSFQCALLINVLSQINSATFCSTVN